MWKVFEYGGRQRVAYIPEEGPAFQILDAGEWVTGFRSFKPEKMENVGSADHLFDMIPEDILNQYPLLEKANV